MPDKVIIVFFSYVNNNHVRHGKAQLSPMYVSANKTRKGSVTSHVPQQVKQDNSRERVTTTPSDTVYSVMDAV